MTALSTDSVLAFAPGHKLRFDSLREEWQLLGPERLFQPDPIAVEVLQLIDGRRDVQTIIENLAERFDAPREEIARDVLAMLRDLVERCALRS